MPTTNPNFEPEPGPVKPFKPKKNKNLLSDRMGRRTTRQRSHHKTKAKLIFETIFLLFSRLNTARPSKNFLLFYVIADSKIHGI